MDPSPTGKGLDPGASTWRPRPRPLCLGSHPSDLESLFPSDLLLLMPGTVGLPRFWEAQEPSGPGEAVSDPSQQVSWGFNLIPVILARAGERDNLFFAVASLQASGSHSREVRWSSGPRGCHSPRLPLALLAGV